ncbi:hypothetical protein PPYC2_21790 [Paenibacillus polymyxa]|uniref:hypothetical protein n=1 Tax=Paenibacillus polymyxa TaxID=1406 RepID=UPI0008FAF614|nr:hypothetical protein [Paenibacillus polymyxa]APB77418.1 hypothetical protein PPYC2_21790 [Paenibacillus polymyxa]
MDKKIQEIREAHAKEENFLLQYPTSSTRKAHEYIGYLLQQIDIKDKALEFYENKNNHQWGVEEGTMGEVIESEVMMDYGDIARAALKGEDTSE